MVDDLQYEYTSAQAIRGTETKTVAKWERDGWELDSRSQGLLRTELTFRRVQPTTFGSRIRAAFNRLEPNAQRGLLAASGAFVVLAIAGGVVTGVQAGDGSPAPAASTAEVVAGAASEVPSEEAPSAPTTTPADLTIASPAPPALQSQAAAPVAPQPQTPAPVAPQPVAPRAPDSPAITTTYFQNCSAARAAGAAPVRRGDAGYGSHLDSDDDGVGCE